MNLCSDGHEEVCFDSRQCPVCAIKTQLEEIKLELKESEKKRLELQIKVDDV